MPRPDPAEPGPFLAVLITKGRRTGKEHAVTLRAVLHGGRYYFSRHRPDGDWFKNALHDGAVRISVDGREAAGRAVEVTDRDLAETVSALKYPREKRAGERRAAIQVTLDE